MKGTTLRMFDIVNVINNSVFHTGTVIHQRYILTSPDMAQDSHTPSTPHTLKPIDDCISHLIAQSGTRYIINK